MAFWVSLGPSAGRTENLRTTRMQALTPEPDDDRKPISELRELLLERKDSHVNGANGVDGPARFLVDAPSEAEIEQLPELYEIWKEEP